MGQSKAKTSIIGLLVTATNIIALLHTASSASFYKGECKIGLNNNDMPEAQPLLLRPGSSEIMFPNLTDVLNIDSRKKVRLVCAGSNNSFVYENSGTAIREVSPSCVTGNMFNPGNGKLYKFKELGCQKMPEASALKNGDCVDKKYTRIKTGFELPKNGFAATMDLCFDQEHYDAVYSAYKLTPNIVGRQHNITRPWFKPSTFYDKVNVDKLYIREEQRATLAKILKSRELAEKYIKNDKVNFLARGHLTAKADFIYGSEQHSTFFYMNAAPQWQIFNAGNWLRLEIDVRDFAMKRTSELIVVTGIWGNCELPDVKGDLQQLHLYVDENANQAVRVPGYFWKVLHDAKTKEGVAFVSINNPHLSKVTNEHVFCKDICDNFKWLTWDSQNITLGYSFCCEYDDFRKTVNTVPEFKVDSIFKE